MTKLRKIPLRTTTIKTRRQDALVPNVLNLLDDWNIKKTISDDELLKELHSLVDKYSSGVKYMEMPLDYKEHILDALQTMPKDERSGQPRGFGPREQRKRNKIIKIVEEAEGELLLENSDWSEVKQAVEDTPMALLSPGIEEFYDAVDNAEEVEVAEKKKDDKETKIGADPAEVK